MSKSIRRPIVDFVALSICCIGTRAYATRPCETELSLRREALTMQLEEQVAYEKLGQRGLVEFTVMSPDRTRLAIVSREESPLAGSVAHLKVYQTSNMEMLLTETFMTIRKVEFLADNQRLGVVGLRNSDNGLARLYILKMESTTQAPLRIGSSPPLPALPAPPLSSLKLPGSPYHGVGVEQLISRSDLPHLVVIQNSSNPVATIRRTNAQWGVDPNTSVLNFGAFLFDRETLAPVESLTFDGLSPVEANLNPRSALMAFHLQNPIVAEARGDSVVVVDLTVDPKRPLYTFRVGRPALLRPIGPGRVVHLENRIATEWSPDGRKLATFEKTSGTVAIYDTVTHQEFLSTRNLENRWRIAGGAILRDDRLLLIRYGSEPSGADAESRQLFGFIVDLKSPQSITSALDEVRTPDFEIERSTRKDVLQSVDFRGDELRHIFAMNHGRQFALVFRNELVLIDAQNTTDQRVLVPNGGVDRALALLHSVEKVGEDTLRLSDRDHGVFLLKID